MKKILFSFFVMMLLTSASIYAQIPQAINFQAIARDINGNPLISTSIQIRLSVIDSAQGGTIVYQELRALTTTSYGSFSFQIGVNPNFVTVGSFQAIQWSTGDKYLQIDYDPTNMFNWNLTLGVIKFVSVPYAFAAGEVVYIDMTNVHNGDILVFNSGTGKFEPQAYALYTAGTGIQINGTTINNLAPDQVVSLTSGTGIAVSGTYPSFTIEKDFNIQPRSAMKGQKLTVTFSGGPGMSFAPGSSTTCPQQNSYVILHSYQGSGTTIYPYGTEYIDSKTIEATFDITTFFPSQLYDIILSPGTPCEYTIYSGFKVH
jgi:hypothetical protein